MKDQEPKVKSPAKALTVLSFFTVQEPAWGVTKSNIYNILTDYLSIYGIFGAHSRHPIGCGDREGGGHGSS